MEDARWRQISGQQVVSETDPKTTRQEAADRDTWRSESAQVEQNLLYLLRTIMMSPDDQALEDLLYGSDLGDEAEGSELGDGGRGPVGVEESAAAADIVTCVRLRQLFPSRSQ